MGDQGRTQDVGEYKVFLECFKRVGNDTQYVVVYAHCDRNDTAAEAGRKNTDP